MQSWFRVFPCAPEELTHLSERLIVSRKGLIDGTGSDLSILLFWL